MEVLSVFLFFSTEAPREGWPGLNFGFLRSVCVAGLSFRLWACLAWREVTVVGFKGVPGVGMEGLRVEEALELAWEGLDKGLDEGLGAG